MRESPDRLPPVVSANFDDSVGELWRARLRQHTFDSYAGVRISKFPEDLRIYEHLLWLDAPNVVIEIGAQFGGSTLWFRDRLRTLAGYGRVSQPRVIAIELDMELLRGTLEAAHGDDLDGIEFVEGDVTDAGLPERIARMLAPGDRCMVIEDSAHTYETTMAALEGFARFVPVGGYFIVEDGCVDVEELRISDDWPRGVLPALREWLASPQGQAFEVRDEAELYGISCHPGGFLRRASASAASAATSPNK
jgi:cephalosporin hydroxylase